jgi:nucleotide-binding universal stress UspA family protein
MDAAATSGEDRPVVAGVDGTRTWSAVVDLAAAEAARRSAPLLIVHAWPGRYEARFRRKADDASGMNGRRLIETIEDRVTSAAWPVPVRTELIRGVAGEVLATRSRDACLLVVGHRNGTAPGSGWGSTASHLAEHSAAPLLVHRGWVGYRGPIIVAVSARPGERSARYAFEMADQLGARLAAVHVWNRGRADGAGAPSRAPGDKHPRRNEAERRLAQALNGWSSAFPQVAAQGVLISELEVPYTLDQASRRGQVLVVGMGRQGRVAGLVTASLRPAEERHLHCPVLLVPPDGTTPARG